MSKPGGQWLTVVFTAPESQEAKVDGFWTTSRFPGPAP